MSEGFVTNSVVQAQEQGQGADALVTAPRPRDAIDHAADFCERVMPDLPMLGLAMVLFVLYLVASGTDFGVSDDALAAQQEAAEAASASPDYVPF